MKGRPITGEEFDRLLDKVASVVSPRMKKGKTPSKKQAERTRQIVASWQDYLKGLWWSGLRLRESLDLWWDRDDRLCVDLSGKHPMLRIPAACEKGNRDRLLPMAPEFAEFLLATPEHKRTGRVFRPLSRRVCGEYLGHFRVSETICEIGKVAGVKVSTDPRTGRVKYASAHDLRRSFGERWAARVMPHVLKELMRHESIDTTMKYYVGRNAQSTAQTLWESHRSNRTSNTSGNSRPISAAAAAEAIPQSVDNTEVRE